jgi:hypothetical protein
MDWVGKCARNVVPFLNSRHWAGTMNIVIVSEKRASLYIVPNLKRRNGSRRTTLDTCALMGE